MNSFLLVFMAFVPIIWLLVSLGVLKMASHKACLIAVIITSIISYAGFNMPGVLIGQSIVEGSVYSILSICWVIIAALFVYNITLKTGALDVIQSMLYKISSDRRIQALVIAFAFGGFLEAVAGFGTAVAIPAGILIAMGFQPLKAAVVCLVANTVPVAFGVLGVPVITLAEVTGLELGKLAFDVCIQLIPFAVVLPLLLVYIVAGKLSKVKGVVCISVLSGVAFSVGQTLTAVYVGVELAAVVGSLSSLILIIVWCKLFPIKDIFTFDNQEVKEEVVEKITTKQALIAWIPYILALVFIVIVQLFPVLKEGPFVISKQFYFGEGGKAVRFAWLSNGGTLLFLSAVISGFIQGMNGSEILATFVGTIKQVKLSILTIVLVVSLAKLMTYSGIVETSAAFVAAASGRFFPALSPFVGALGTFITGSDTSSNILFGNLQQQTALKLDMDQYWIAAGNGSGATAGKMISPQSISIAASSTNYAAKESDMMRSTLKYCVLYVVLMGVFVYVLN